MPMLAVIGGAASLGWRVLADRPARSRRRCPRPRRARSAAGRSRTRRRRAARARRSRACARAARRRCSAITRSPAGWPSVSLTCLKLSRSSISSAPTVFSRRLRASSVRRSSSKRRRFFSPVSGSWLACAAAPASARCGSRPGPARRAGRPARCRRRRSAAAGRRPGRLGSRTTSSQVRSAIVDRRRRRVVERQARARRPSGRPRPAARRPRRAAPRSPPRPGRGTWKAPVGEADQGGAALGHGRGRRPVAVDGPEDVDAGAADRQAHDPGRRRLAAVAGAAQVGRAPGSEPRS